LPEGALFVKRVPSGAFSPPKFIHYFLFSTVKKQVIITLTGRPKGAILRARRSKKTTPGCGRGETFAQDEEGGIAMGELYSKTP